jgi:hypothetical protein
MEKVARVFASFKEADDADQQADVAAAMRQINQAWLDGEVEDLAPMLHRNCHGFS